MASKDVRFNTAGLFFVGISEVVYADKQGTFYASISRAALTSDKVY